MKRLKDSKYQGSQYTLKVVVQLCELTFLSVSDCQYPGFSTPYVLASQSP